MGAERRDCPAALMVSKGFLEEVTFYLRPKFQAGNSLLRGLKSTEKIVPSRENSMHCGPRVKEHIVYFAQE